MLLGLFYIKKYIFKYIKQSRSLPHHKIRPFENQTKKVSEKSNGQV